MAEISTLILKVDLNCCKCNKKIQKILSKFHCEIQTQTFDLKQNTVTISGPFDPCCFSRKLRCKAGKAIQCIEIVTPPLKQTAQDQKPKPVKKPEPQKVKKQEPAKVEKPEQAPPVYIVPCYPPAPCYFGCGGTVDRCYCCFAVNRLEPCYCGCGGRRVEPLLVSYCGCGRPQPCYCGCGGTKPRYGSSCDYYFIEDNPSPCSVM